MGEERMEMQPHEGWDVGEMNPRLRIVCAVVLAVLALASVFVLGRFATDPAVYKGTVEVLDAKKDTVMSLMAASTASSAALSVLPGDMGTPIAEKLVDLSSNFLVVLAAIYLEKYLLTIMGFASFRVLIPFACAFMIGALALWNNPKGRLMFSRLSVKLVLFALIIVAVVPVSVFVSGMIEQTYQASIDETIQSAEQTTDAIEKSTEETEKENKTGLSNPLGALTAVPETIAGLTDAARNSLNRFIEALAVMIVTSCVIPILVLLFFLWLARIVLGVNIEIPQMGRRRHL